MSVSSIAGGCLSKPASSAPTKAASSEHDGVSGGSQEHHEGKPERDFYEAPGGAVVTPETPSLLWIIRSLRNN